MIFETDSEYKVVNRIIDTEGVNDIKALSFNFVIYGDQREVLGYDGTIGTNRRQ